MENGYQQKKLGIIMNMGFEKAAQSFSKLVGRTMSFVHGNAILVHHDQEFSYVTGERGNLMVLTTEVIGGLSGRSYLILSDREQEEICESVSPGKKMDPKLQEALLLEIDNIISASVISELANHLAIEVYGDVPRLQYVKADAVEEVISTDIPHENSSSIILCNTTFLLGNHGHIHPQFIWKLSTKVFELVGRQLVNK